MSVCTVCNGGFGMSKVAHPRLNKILQTCSRAAAEALTSWTKTSRRCTQVIDSFGSFGLSADQKSLTTCPKRPAKQCPFVPVSVCPHGHLHEFHSLGSKPGHGIFCAVQMERVQKRMSPAVQVGMCCWRNFSKAPLSSASTPFSKDRRERNQNFHY